MSKNLEDEKLVTKRAVRKGVMAIKVPSQMGVDSYDQECLRSKVLEALDKLPAKTLEGDSWVLDRLPDELKDLGNYGEKRLEDIRYAIRVLRESAPVSELVEKIEEWRRKAKAWKKLREWASEHFPESYKITDVITLMDKIEIELLAQEENPDEQR